MAIEAILGRGGTKARLLAVLTSTPGQEFHTRELARRADGSLQPTHAALVDLERRGIVRSRRVGNLRLWRMEKSNPLYMPLRELTARTVGVASRIAEVLKRQRGIYVAFVYGSYARGEDDVTSDIDVFVLGEPLWESLFATSRQLSRQLGREVNTVSWSEEDLRRATSKGSPFLDELLTTPKIWIVGDEDDFRGRVERVAREVPRSSPARANVGRRQSKARERRTKARQRS